MSACSFCLLLPVLPIRSTKMCMLVLSKLQFNFDDEFNSLLFFSFLFLCLTRYLLEDPTFKDAPPTKNATMRSLGGYGSFDFEGVSRDLKENLDVMSEWMKVVDEYPEGSGSKFFILKVREMNIIFHSFIYLFVFYFSIFGS